MNTIFYQLVMHFLLNQEAQATVLFRELFSKDDINVSSADGNLW